jgi:DNA-binding CsgD family transcriptional regulator
MAALDDLSHSLGATACLILPHEISDRQFGVVGSTGILKIDELWERNLDWVTHVYEPRGDPYVRQGYRAVTQSQLFSDEEIRHSRYHQEIARPAGCHQWACGIFSVEGRYWCMPFFRGGTEPFAPEIVASIAEVGRRMAGIVGISEKVSRASAENEVRSLAQIGCAAILIDRHGQVRSVNRPAEELFCNEFGIRHGKLWTAAGASLARLDRFMTEIEHAKSTGRPLPAPMIVTRDGGPWLLIEALPLASASIEIFDGCRAILVISDLTQPHFADAALLGLIFGLTAAEARLASALGKGQDLDSAAAEFGVSPQTVRSQLRTIFVKTGWRRQAELVARVAHVRSTGRH